MPADTTLRRLVRITKVPVENRTRLSAAQRGTRPGSLRGAKLAGVAPPRHARDDCPRLSDAGNDAQQKTLLGGPCHRRVMRFSCCSAPGQASAVIAVLVAQIADPNYLT